MKVSHNELLTAIETKRFDVASASMPSKIEDSFAQPKIFELEKAIGHNRVLSQVEFELTKLAANMNVGNNLTGSQVEFIAGQLVSIFPNESLADFKICFQRGAIGQYGAIQRMDGITLRGWIESYLDEKYALLEETLKKEKAATKQTVADEIENTEWSQETKEKVDAFLEVLRNSKMRSAPNLTEAEIKKEGQANPPKKKAAFYPFTTAEDIAFREKKIEYGRLFSDSSNTRNYLKPGAPSFDEWILNPDAWQAN